LLGRVYLQRRARMCQFRAHPVGRYRDKFASVTMGTVHTDNNEVLTHALALVQRDIDATAEEPHTLHFVSLPKGAESSEELIFLAIENGSYWSGGTSCFDQDEETALASIADTAQDCLMEVTHQVWPICPDHDRGVQVRNSDGARYLDGDDNTAPSPTWWCDAGAGHSVSAIGTLSRRA
jgi:hypothetical protein